MRGMAAEAPDFDEIVAAVRALAEAQEARAQGAADAPRAERAPTDPPLRPTPLRVEAPPRPEAPALKVVERAEPPAPRSVDVDPETKRLKRMLEALLFAAEAPVGTETLRRRLPEGADVSSLLAALQADYADRGVHLVRVANKWRFETAADVAPVLKENRAEPQKLSRAALETLAIIAYHQPATRAEIEAVRGVAVSKGTLDHLLEIGWVRPRGRRRAPGRPVVYVTTDAFLEHFGLESLEDLPGKDDLKAAGLLDDAAPDDFEVPDPSLADVSGLDPLEDEPAESASFHTDYGADGD